MARFPFKTGTHFRRPCAILHSPGHLRCGTPLYFIDFLIPEHQGGGHVGLWSGVDLDEALDTAFEIEREGTRVFSVDGNAHPDVGGERLG